MKKLLIFNIFLIALAPVLSDNNPIDLEQIKKNLTSLLPELPDLPNFPQLHNLPDLADIANTTEDAKKLFREKCIKNSGSDAAYEEAEQAATTLMDCMKDLVDFEKLQEEIEKAKPVGDLDTVFNKYCKKRTMALECVSNFTTSIDPCLEEAERKQKTVFTNIFQRLLEFVCHKDGDQIALFIAEKGPECFTDKQDSITNCINATFHNYMPKETPSLENLPNLLLTEKECKDMDKLQICIVKQLTTCEESTPANLVESLFKFIKNETPCANHTTTTSTNPNSSEIHKLSFNVLLGTWILALLAKLLITH